MGLEINSDETAATGLGAEASGASPRNQSGMFPTSGEAVSVAGVRSCSQSSSCPADAATSLGCDGVASTDEVRSANQSRSPLSLLAAFCTGAVGSSLGVGCADGRADTPGAPRLASHSKSAISSAGTSCSVELAVTAPGGAIAFSQSGISAAAKSPIGSSFSGSRLLSNEAPSWNSPLDGPQPDVCIQSGI